MKRLFLPLAMLFFGACASAQVPSFKSFNPTQFSTNNFIISITNGALVTNLNVINDLFLNSTNIVNLFAPLSGGSGNVWTNYLGRIMPIEGNTNNVLSFTSGLADNATNVAMVVGTTNYWSASGSKLAEFKNAGQDSLHVSQFGGLMSGNNTESFWGPLSDGEALVLNQDLDAGDPDLAEIWLGVSSATNSGYIDLKARQDASTLTIKTLQYLTQLDVGYLKFDQDSHRNFYVDPVGALGGGVFFNYSTNSALGATNLIVDFQHQGTRAFAVKVGSGYTGAGTLFLSDDGTYKTGVGAAELVWTNYLGRIMPIEGNTNNVLTFTSGLADNATNVAMVVNTTNLWSESGSLLLVAQNAGTNKVRISKLGGITIGPNVEAVTGGSIADDGRALFALNVTDDGDPHSWEIWTGSLQAADYSKGYGTFDVLGSTNQATLTMQARTAAGDADFRTIVQPSGVGIQSSLWWSGTRRTILHPTVTSSGSAVAYLFDTSNYLNTSGDLLASFKNAGTNQLVIDPQGSVYSGAQTLALWGSGAASDVLVSLADADNGGPNGKEIFMSTRNGSGEYWADIFTGISSQFIEIGTAGTTKMKLDPRVSSSGTAVAYLFDTSNVQTNGDTFVSIRNAGTPIFQLAPAEAGNPAGQIVFGPGATNVLYRSGTALIATNGSNTASLAVVNGLGTRLDLTFLSNGSEPRLDSSSGFIWFADTSVFEANIIPDSDNARDIGNTSSSGAWRNIISKGTTYLQGSNDGLGNYTRLAMNHGGNAGNVVVNTEAAGTQTVRPIVVQRGGSDRYYTATAAKTLTESSATTVLNVTLTSTNVAGGTIRYTIKGDDNVDYQSRNGIVVWSAVNKGGTVTTGLTQGTEDVAASAGTLTATWTAVANGNSIDLKCNAVSSLSQTTLEAYWEMDMRSSGTSTITPQ